MNNQKHPKTSAFMRGSLSILIFISITVLAISPLTGCHPSEQEPQSNSAAQHVNDVTTATTSTSRSLPHAKNVFTDSKNAGGCRELIGNITVTVVFANDPTASWTTQAIQQKKQQLTAAANTLKQQASRYGQSLAITFVYKTATATQTPSVNDYEKFVVSALANAKLPEKKSLNSSLKKTYGCSAAPVVFCVNHDGRAFASSNTGGELAILFREKETSFIHELLHIFGASDLYYPDSVKALAVSLFKKSVMLDASEPQVDELTAYLVGWSKTISPAAESFLKQTDYLTNDMMKEAAKENTYTGKVTNHNTGNGIYTGDLLNGVLHGQGTLAFKNGDSYTGSWEHGKQHGQGTYRWKNGDLYVGSWVNGIKQGFGTITWASGDNYAGNWVNGKKQGKGTMTWTDGAHYTGDWVNNKKQGYGVMTWSNDMRHEGEWVNDLRHGKGTLYRADGTVARQGTWKNDTFVE